MIRDRKMYVAPTPFALTEGTTGALSLIIPADLELDDRYKVVGELTRIETDELVIGYQFDLMENQISTTTIENPSKGKEHSFKACRPKFLNQPEVLLT